MKKLLTALCLAALASVHLFATTYYVSSSAGSDSNDGVSQSTPWKTLSKVNSAALVAGDTVLLARGNTWRESLIPPASGTSSSPISFDAYGDGAAPGITGLQDLSSVSWTLVSGNVWQTSVSGTGVNNALFATIWGQKQTSQGALQHDRDFYFSANKLYIYSVGNPATYYGSIAAITTAAGQLIYVNGKTWLSFQHISLSWFDGFGVNVAGASDHLIFANMESNGMVPAGTLPHGFYINASSPGDITFYNDEAHLNYDGFRFDGSATAITLVNCKGYANRDGGLVDNTSHAAYSYSHFYANNIAIFNSQDIQGGPTDAGNNLPVDTPPAVVNFTTYPARITFTVDDVGFAPGTETYVDSLLPVFTARSLKLSAAVTTGYASGLVNEIQSWLTAGHDVNSHSWSHQYYTNTNTFTIRYTGSGSAATITISANHLTTTITGGPGGENLNYDLTNSAYDTASELVAAINAHGGYTAALDINCRTAAHTIGLSDVSAQDIKSSAYTALFQKDRLEPDELASSRNWLQTNIPGLSNVKTFVYPDGIEDAQTQAWAAAAGYEGARGALSIGLGSNFVYSKGVNIQNITSLAIAGLHGMTAQQVDAKLAALVFKASVWGVPYSLFVHLNELAPDEVATTLDSLLAHGALVMTNTQLMDWLASTPNLAGTTSYVSAAAGARANFLLTTASPILNAGTNLGPSYRLDLAGLVRPQASPWDIGAYGHLSAVYGTGVGPGAFAIGAPPAAPGGPPLTYAARTDTCELASDTYNGQNCGTLGLDVSLREQDGVSYPNVGGYKGETLDQAHCPSGAWNGSTCTRATNVQYVDPDFHSINIRATDGVDYPGTTSGFSPTGPSGGDQNWWNADSTIFMIGDSGGGNRLRYFDPSTRTVTYSRISSGPNLDSTHFRGNNSLQPSGVYPYVWFERDNVKINKLVIDPVADTITRTQIVDLANAGSNCLPTGYVPNWEGNFGVSADDQTFTVSAAGGPDWTANTAVSTSPEYFIVPASGNAGHYGYQAMTSGTTVSSHTGFAWPQSPTGKICDDGSAVPCGAGIVEWDSIDITHNQGDGFDLVSYTIGQGCRYFNTRTGKIRGDWGCSYPIGAGNSCSGPASASIVTENDIICGGAGYCNLPDRFTMHGAAGIGDPKFVHISSSTNECLLGTGNCVGFVPGAGGVYFWQADSNAVRPCNATWCGGHQAKGYVYEYGGSGSYRSRLYSLPILSGAVNPGVYIDNSLPCDDHGSYNNSGTQDLSPLFKMTTFVPTDRGGVSAAGCDEVIGVKTDGSKTTYRFASTYNSGAEQYFSPQNAIGIVSQDGKWVLRNSDVMGTVGSINGANTCNQLRADNTWSKNTAYSNGYRIMQLGSNNIFEAACSGSCTSGTSITFCSTVGCQITDNQVTWTNLGQNDCRADFFITDLVSAH